MLALRLLPDDVEAFVDEFLVLFADVHFGGGFAGELGVELGRELRLAPGSPAKSTTACTSSSETNAPWPRVKPADAGRAIEEVALAEQIFRAVLVEDDARVESARHLEGDARGDVRLDHAGDDFAARRLRGDDEMDAGGAGLGGQAGDGAFDVGGRGLHEIGQLVDDDDDVGELVGDDEVVLARHADGRRIGGLVRRPRPRRFVVDVDVEEFQSAAIPARARAARRGRAN